jgi:hypothetical protein
MPGAVRNTSSFFHLVHLSLATTAEGSDHVGSEKNPCSMCTISVPGGEKTMAVWILGDWEHGACLGSLQASQEQRHVENSALVLGVSREKSIVCTRRVYFFRVWNTDPASLVHCTVLIYCSNQSKLSDLDWTVKNNWNPWHCISLKIQRIPFRGIQVIDVLQGPRSK